ncbi:MAG: hypothetical protein N0A24_10225 [Armatimonadetes bacterium]|nr:hypothetical protein [Armatimonadota bacterium]MDW8154549.1 hypothetical protein [Armatimonadota bacterium]
MEVRLLRNPAFGRGADPTVPRYFYMVRLSGEGEARLPVYWAPRPDLRDPLLREAYRVQVAGRTLEAGNLQVLGEQVRMALGALLVAGRLSRFWLVNGTSAIPVYREGKAHVALTDGPKLWGNDLAQLRARYVHYLASCNGGRCDPVTVALFSPADLDLHPPEAVLVGPGLWIPVFAHDGCLTAFGPADRCWSVPSGPAALLALWEQAAGDLAARGLLPHPGALWAAELSARARGTLLAASEPTGLALRFVGFRSSGAGRVTLPVRRLERWVFASCEEDSCLHVAPDPATLRTHLSEHLVQEGVVTGAHEVVLELDAGGGTSRGSVLARSPALDLASSKA